MKRSKGVTLIELVVVLVILGIISAVAAPKYLSLSRDAKIAGLKHFAGAYQEMENMVSSQLVIEGKDIYSEEVMMTSEGVVVEMGGVKRHPIYIKMVMDTGEFKFVGLGGASDKNYDLVILPPSSTLSVPDYYQKPTGYGTNMSLYIAALSENCYLQITNTEPTAPNHPDIKIIEEYSGC